MASSLTPKYLARNKINEDYISDPISTGAHCKKSTAGQWEIDASKGPFGDLYLTLYHGTTNKASLVISSTGSTFSAEGQGDKTILADSVLTAKSSKEFILGPFESARFADVSTGGSILRVNLCTSNGTSDLMTGSTKALLGAFQIVPNT
jgi:hypothetical protein